MQTSAVMNCKEKQRRNNVTLTFHLTPGVHGLKLTNGSLNGEVSFFIIFFCLHILPQQSMMKS